MDNKKSYICIILILIIIYFMYRPYFNYKYEILKLKTYYYFLRFRRLLGPSNY